MVTWQARARYMRALSDLRHELNRELDRAQTGDDGNSALFELLVMVEREQRRYREALLTG